MLKKIFAGVLIALSSFGVFSVTEAHYNDNYDCRDGYCQRRDVCCRGGYAYNRGDSQNYYGCCDGEYGCY